MPGSGGYGASTLAQTVAMRGKLSAVRKRIGLEQGSQNQMAPQADMQPAQPVGANTPVPAAVVSPQAAAVMGPAPMSLGMRHGPESLEGLHVPVQGSGEPFQWQHPPGQLENMHAMAQQFLEQQQQAAPPAAPAPAPSGPPTPAATPEAMPEAAPAPAAPAASPIGRFMEQTGRMPTAHELAVIGAAQKLTAVLGRSPSPAEIQHYFTQGAK